MAQRDSNQGFGFMYADISKLINKKKELEKDGAFTPLNTEGTQAINFNRDSKSEVAQLAQKTTGSDNAINPFVKERAQAINQIRENLDRLQSLHHKLHAMLEELNKITEKKRKTD